MPRGKRKESIEQPLIKAPRPRRPKAKYYFNTVTRQLLSAPKAKPKGAEWVAVDDDLSVMLCEKIEKLLAQQHNCREVFKELAIKFKTFSDWAKGLAEQGQQTKTRRKKKSSEGPVTTTVIQDSETVKPRKRRSKAKQLEIAS
jgi:hypothetical protein